MLCGLPLYLFFIQSLACQFVFQIPITISLPYFPLRALNDVCKVSSCLNAVMQAYIPVKNCDYIILLFHVFVSIQFWSNISHIEHGFSGLLTPTAFRVIIYSKYLCLLSYHRRLRMILRSARAARGRLSG